MLAQKFDLRAIALMAATAFAFQEQGNYAATAGSYYESGREGIVSGAPEQAIQALYYNYVYGEYYGQTVAAIIFLDILIPIACCIGIIVTIVCVVRAINRRRMYEAQQAH